MNFEKALRFSVYFTLVSGALVMSVAQRHVLHGILAGAACLLHHIAATRRPGFALSRKAAAFLAITAVAYTVYDLTNTEYILFSAGNFLIMLQIIKIFQKKTNRDCKEIFLMSLVLVGVAAVMTVDVVFAPTFILYVASAVWSLLLLTIKVDSEAGGVQPELGRRAVAAGGALSAGCFMGAVVIFLVFPRIGPSFSQLLAPNTKTLAGFTETVHLRESGTIKPNPQVVFRATLSGPRAASLGPEQLLWRGVALDYFDGHTWSNRTPRRGQFRPVRMPFSSDEEDPSKILIQKIDLSPTGSHVFFTLGHVTGISTINEPGASVRHDAVHDIWSTPYPGSSILTYQARSELVSDDDVPAADEPIPPDKKIYAAASGVSVRVLRLANEIAPDSKCPTMLSKAKAVQRYLEENYTYVPELPGEVDDPVDHFLIEKKRGHCEVFATAMAVLLRCRGVPTRIVNGYCGGDWNEFLGVWIVRQTNAHSWVEVYFPSLGKWVQFNPSPMAASFAGPRTGLLAYLSRVKDYMNIKWADNIIYYGQQHQTSLARHLTNLLVNSIEWLRDTRGARTSAFGAILKWVLRAVIAAPIAYLLWLGGSKLVRLRRGIHRTKAAQSGTKFYRDLLRLLEKRGYRRQPSQTPLEFARCVVAREGPHWDDVNAITRIFCTVRYGGNHAGAEPEVEQRMSRLRAMVKGRKAH